MLSRLHLVGHVVLAHDVTFLLSLSLIFRALRDLCDQLSVVVTAAVLVFQLILLLKDISHHPHTDRVVLLVVRLWAWLQILVEFDSLTLGLIPWERFLLGVRQLVSAWSNRIFRLLSGRAGLTFLQDIPDLKLFDFLVGIFALLGDAKALTVTLQAGSLRGMCLSLVYVVRSALLTSVLEGGVAHLIRLSESVVQVVAVTKQVRWGLWVLRRLLLDDFDRGWLVWRRCKLLAGEVAANTDGCSGRVCWIHPLPLAWPRHVVIHAVELL